MRSDRARKIAQDSKGLDRQDLEREQRMLQLALEVQQKEAEIEGLREVRNQQSRRIAELADRFESTRDLAVSLLQAKMRSARLEGYVDRVRELDGKPPPSERPGLQALEQALRVADNQDFKRITDAMSTEDIDTILREGPTPPSYGGTR